MNYVIYDREYTPDHIRHLAKNEIFVFGSNLEGAHLGGAAKCALENFGAVMGVGDGLQGNSYAIPTMPPVTNPPFTGKLMFYVDKFIKFARRHPELKFFVTRIGCGIAGFDESYIAPMFIQAATLGNVILPKSFCEYFSPSQPRKCVPMSLLFEAPLHDVPPKYIPVRITADKKSGDYVCKVSLEKYRGYKIYNVSIFNIFREECSDQFDFDTAISLFHFYERHKNHFPPQSDDFHRKNVQCFIDTINTIRTSKLWDGEKETVTTFYDPNPFPPNKLPKKTDVKTEILVTKSRTFEAARNLAEKYPGKKIAVLNFASSTSPGGGVIRGCNAQEESLCRVSTLYDALDTEENWEHYYSFHREKRTPLASDALLYSTNITVFKSDDLAPSILPPEKWMKVDVITCAAPNFASYCMKYLKPEDYTPEAQERIHLSRGRKILSVARHHGAEILVLGAFGCGAFHNDPRAVASAYKQLVQEFDGHFDSIEFAVYCKDNQPENYEVFKEILG